MKRRNYSIGVLLTVLALILLSTHSCTKQTFTNQPVTALSDLIPDRSNAINLQDVSLYLRAYKGILETKSNDVGVTPVVIDGDTLFYLVNYERGWELLSADRRAPRRLIWAEDGTASVEDLYNNPASEAVFQTVVDGMSALVANQEWEASTKYSDSWDDLYLRDECGPWELISVTVEERDTIQDHLTVTRWGQGSPWNVCAPYTNSTLSTHCPTGCVPVAAAQTLYYLRDKYGLSLDTYENCYTDSYVENTSTGLILEESDVDFASYNHSDSLWARMPLSASDNSNYFSAVSALMIRMGVDLEVIYNVTGTSGNVYGIKNMYSSRYGINSTYTSLVDFDTVVEEIIGERRPVILGISRLEGGVRYGHAVVADAGREITRITTRVYRKWISPLYPDPTGPKGPGEDLGSYAYKTEVSEELLARYVGINWGWDGSFMYSGTSPIWFNTKIMSWTVGPRTYTAAERMLYDFNIIG